MKMLNAIINLMRPQQWVKNFFLFVPLFFTPAIWSVANFALLLQGFFTFSLLASTIYIFNDLNDIDSDRAHPLKKKRPLAAKIIKPQTAVNAMLLLGCATAALAWFTSSNPVWMMLLALYLIINAFYSAYLKHTPLVDVAIVASGFVIRALAGCALLGLFASPWLLIGTFFLGLFIAVGKRKNDLKKLSATSKKHRGLEGYNLAFVDGTLVMLAGINVLFYSLYTFSLDVVARLGTDQLFWTVPLVTFIFLRYLQISFVENKSSSPTKVALTDLPLQFILLAWVLVSGWFIYGA